MKRISAIMLIFVMCFTFSGCYNNDEIVDGVFLCYSKLLRNCFVGSIEYCRGEDTNIALPSEHKGYPVNKLGGYLGRGFPCPFVISVSGDGWFPDEVTETFSTSEKYLYTDFFDDAEVVVEDIKFNIILPNELDEVVNAAADYIYCGEIKDASENKTKVYVIRPVYYLTIAENNEYFYTENGKLYDKKTKTLVTGITYDAWAAKSAKEEIWN